MVSGSTLLLVEDNQDIAEMMFAYLEHRGYVLDYAADGVTGLHLAVSNNYDVIVLDLMLPGMDGLDGLKRMLAQDNARGVALISGTANREIADAALAAGASGFLPKTLSAKSVVNAVRFMAMGEQYAPLEFMRAEEDDTPDLAA